MMNELSDPIKARRAERAREIRQIAKDFVECAAKVLMWTMLIIGTLAAAVGIVVGTLALAVVLARVFNPGFLGPIVAVAIVITLVVLIAATCDAISKAKERRKYHGRG